MEQALESEEYERYPSIIIEQQRSLQDWTTSNSSVWGDQRHLQEYQSHQQHPLQPPPHNNSSGTSSGFDAGAAGAAGDGANEYDARSYTSEAPRLDWHTPRVSAISMGTWAAVMGGGGGGPRSDGGSSSVVAIPRSATVRSQRSLRSQRSTASRNVGGGDGVLGRSSSFRPRRMAEYAAPVPNLPLRYLRQSRRERSVAAGEQQATDGAAGTAPASATHATAVDSLTRLETIRTDDTGDTSVTISMTVPRRGNGYS